MSKRQNLCSPRYAFYVSLNRNYAVYIFVADKRVEELDNTRHVIQIGASINNSPRESSQKNGDLMLHRTNLMERALRHGNVYAFNQWEILYHKTCLLIELVANRDSERREDEE